MNRDEARVWANRLASRTNEPVTIYRRLDEPDKYYMLRTSRLKVEWPIEVVEIVGLTGSGAVSKVTP